MTKSKFRRKKILRRTRIAGWTALSGLITTALGFLTFLHIVLPADREFTVEVFKDPRVDFSTETEHLTLAPTQAANSTGILLLPTSRVHEYGYLYHFSELVAEGYTLVVVQPPLNHPIFENRTFSELTQGYPEIQRWVLAGHGAGGLKACRLANQALSTHLLLLDSYCDIDISRLKIEVLQIIASEDSQVPFDEEERNQSYLPENSSIPIQLADIGYFSFGAFELPAAESQGLLSPEEARKKLSGLIQEWLQSAEPPTPTLSKISF